VKPQKTLRERLQDVAVAKIDNPGLEDHIKIATLYLETCPPKEVLKEFDRVWALHTEEESRRYKLEARVADLEYRITKNGRPG
jgi:hypothetical protein